SATGGDIAMVATGGPLTVVENVTTPGAITLTAIERVPPGAGDDLIAVSVMAPGVVTFSTPGAITLTAIERVPPGAGDDLTINPGVVVQSTASTVSLLAGDLVTVQAGSTVQAA